MLINQSIARVRAYRKAKGWSILRFATEAGMGESTIRQIDSADWSPTAATLRKLESIIPADFAPMPVRGSRCPNPLCPNPTGERRRATDRRSK